jgi:cyclohexyl-isocyanide hydratase
MMGAREVAIIAYEGVDELDLMGVLAPLRKAEEAAKGALRTRVIGPGSFRGGCGSLITPDQTFCDPFDFAALDALVLPGGKGAQAAVKDSHLSHFVLAARAAGAPIYAVCSGALILRDLALLKGLCVASHGQKQDLLAGAGCTLGSGVIRDQWLVSAGGFGPGDGLKGAEVAFHVLRDLAPQLVMGVAERMELWPQTREQSAAAIGVEVEGVG